MEVVCDLVSLEVNLLLYPHMLGSESLRRIKKERLTKKRRRIETETQFQVLSDLQTDQVLRFKLLQVFSEILWLNNRPLRARRKEKERDRLSDSADPFPAIDVELEVLG